ncbi:enoyl-CoA hydratase/isomerase family protein [Streptomyces sp. NA04227]|uniref:enoyl-CoA hydratase/isomerase family protein n=1 Tax=Streptomyces sp. NA04227 TaxID=2742136 RepID=UPI0015916CB4|nr:enoyl-CoA hydratase/isomerase family protein [Streptomyces sp. NA04227]QKW09680.1 enoyl-CoA hydratase/isomerase family protein [Streptomyces sp. NA04227]
MPAEPGASPAVRVEEAEPGIALVTLDRPARRNALDAHTLGELSRVFAELDARAAVLTGSGPSFCAGYDLHSVAGPDFDRLAEPLIAHPAHAVFDVMENCAFPVVAAIDGAALGGGLELACSCDARVATRGAVFGIPAGALGLVYSDTGLRRFASVWGGALTREMLLFGRRVDAQRAWQTGVVAELADDGAQVEVALRLARRAARLAPLATAANKRIVGGVLAPASPPPSLDAAGLRRACFGPDGELRAGVEAFLRGGAGVHPLPERQPEQPGETRAHSAPSRHTKP